MQGRYLFSCSCHGKKKVAEVMGAVPRGPRRLSRLSGCWRETMFFCIFDSRQGVIAKQKKGAFAEIRTIIRLGRNSIWLMTYRLKSAMTVAAAAIVPLLFSCTGTGSKGSDSGEPEYADMLVTYSPTSRDGASRKSRSSCVSPSAPTPSTGQPSMATAP